MLLRDMCVAKNVLLSRIVLIKLVHKEFPGCVALLGFQDIPGGCMW